LLPGEGVNVSQIHVASFNLTRCHSYRNVIKVRRARNESTLEPLLGLLPFALHAFLQVSYLHGAPFILRHHLVAFSVGWGLSFAYHVGLLIVAHVTKSAFPAYHVLMVFSFLGALDINAPQLFGVRPLINLDQRGQLLWTYSGLLLAAATHGFFIWDVIGTVCTYFDINCLTLKKKKAHVESEEKRPEALIGGGLGARQVSAEETVIKKKVSRIRLAH
jgi:ethanolaminephosphotransferase